ncbi:MAG TPA: RidA family protein [Candidatus Nanopelagicales bacterium]|nr:RidA family protein [Candidatus Nanopelagicales bacterium]
MAFERAFSGAPWEARVGYCRAVRAGNHIYITGTAPVAKEGGVHAPGDAEAQAARCFEIIEEALRKFGVDRRAVVRTRMFVTDIARWEEFGHAHRTFFDGCPPATTMVEVSRLIDPAMLIEIEADAVVMPADGERGGGAPAGEAHGGGAPAGPAALDPAEPLGALDQAFHDAYAARRDEILAGIGPLIAQIDDRLVLRRAGQRSEGPARTRRFHELKAVDHVPLALFVMLSGRRGPLDAAIRAQLLAYRPLLDAAAGDLERLGLPPEQLARQRRILDASRAFVDDTLAAGSASPPALSAYTRALAPDLLRNVEDAARDQLETTHATVEGWRRAMTPEELDRLQAVVAVSHMSRPGNIAFQYFSLTLGERWEGRFDQEHLRADKRVLAAEAAEDEAAAFALLATHTLDAAVAARFFGEEDRMNRDLLADPAERILAEMFREEPAEPA